MMSVAGNQAASYKPAVDLLVKHGATHDLCSAVQCGDADWVRRTDIGARVNEHFSIEHNGNHALPFVTFTPLHAATKYLNPDLVQALLY
jgi:hypothetical protein